MPKRKSGKAMIASSASSASNGSLDTWTMVAEDGKASPTPPSSPCSAMPPNPTVASEVSPHTANGQEDVLAGKKSLSLDVKDDLQRVQEICEEKQKEQPEEMESANNEPFPSTATATTR